TRAPRSSSTTTARTPHRVSSSRRAAVSTSSSARTVDTFLLTTCSTSIFVALRARERSLTCHLRAVLSITSPTVEDLPQPLRAAGYIADMLRAAGGQVSDQPYSSDGYTYRNVIAAFGPQSEEQVVIGAHYDTFLGFPGADDNASGVAGVLELARLLGAGSPRV